MPEHITVNQANNVFVNQAKKKKLFIAMAFGRTCFPLGVSASTTVVKAEAPL